VQFLSALQIHYQEKYAERKKKTEGTKPYLIESGYIS